MRWSHMESAPSFVTLSQFLGDRGGWWQSRSLVFELRAMEADKGGTVAAESSGPGSGIKSLRGEFQCGPGLWGRAAKVLVFI